MYQIGELVVHPMHGAGVIDAVVQERIAGSQQEYYVLRLPTGGLVLKIPVANAQAIGVRGVMSKEEAETLLASFSKAQVDETSNWSKRYRENLLRMKSGDMNELVQVIKSLLLRERQRGLSTGERKMLHSAKQIFITEVGLVIGMDYDEVDESISLAVRDSTHSG